MKEFELMELSKQEIKQKHKIKPEQKMRKDLLGVAKMQGCDRELQIIFNRYDKMLSHCQNEEEKQQIAIMGIAEVHKLLNVQGALNVNGYEILPAIGKVRDIIE